MQDQMVEVEVEVNKVEPSLSKGSWRFLGIFLFQLQLSVNFRVAL